MTPHDRSRENGGAPERFTEKAELSLSFNLSLRQIHPFVLCPRSIWLLRLGVSQKVTLLFLVDVHFFCLPKRNEPKKRAPEKTTSACLSARYTGLKCATKQAEVRAFSGLPSRLLMN